MTSWTSRQHYKQVNIEDRAARPFAWRYKQKEVLLMFDFNLRESLKLIGVLNFLHHQFTARTGHALMALFLITLGGSVKTRNLCLRA